MLQYSQKLLPAIIVRLNFSSHFVTSYMPESSGLCGRRKSVSNVCFSADVLSTIARTTSVQIVYHTCRICLPKTFILIFYKPISFVIHRGPYFLLSLK